MNTFTLMQLCPRLNSGGIERGVVDVAIAAARQGHRCFVVSGGGRLVAELEKHGVTHFTLPLYSKNPLKFLATLFRLKKLLHHTQPDLLHPQSRMPTWFALCANQSLKIPLITSCCSIHSLGLLKLKKFYNSALLKGKIIISNSYSTKKYLVDNYSVEKNKIAVVYRGVDLEKYTLSAISSERKDNLRKRWNVPVDRSVILLSGRISAWKGQSVLIEALFQYKKKSSLPFYTLLVGELSNQSCVKRIRSQLKSYGLENDVHLCGDCTDMPAAYALADLVISSSIRPEGFGRTVIEAQAMEKWVIATSHGGAQETIEHGKTGWLVPPNDPEALAKELKNISLLFSSKRGEEIKKRARKGIESRFSNKDNCQEVLEIYRSVLGEKHADH